MGKVPRPNIIWRGASASNQTVGRQGRPISDGETFHHVVGSAESAVLVFNNPSRGASSHFVVTDQPGVIFQCVDLNNTAWCDGNWESNLRSITVEHHGDWRNGYDNPTVRENAALLAAWLRDQGLIGSFKRHRQVSQAGTVCPADLPCEAIWNRATDIINAYNAPAPAPQPEWLKNRTTANVPVTVYAQKDGLQIYDLNTGQPSTTDARRWALNQDFAIGSRTTVGGRTFYITVSSTNANAASGFLEGEVKSTPYTAPAPAPAPTPTPPPAPETPDWVDAVIDEPNRPMYVLRATPLIDLENGKPYIKDGKEVWFKQGDKIDDISAHTIVATKTYRLTEYAFKEIQGKRFANANGIASDDLSTEPPVVAPTPTPTPPSTGQQYLDELNKRVGILEKIVKAITDFLLRIFRVKINEEGTTNA